MTASALRRHVPVSGRAGHRPYRICRFSCRICLDGPDVGKVTQVINQPGYDIPSGEQIAAGPNGSVYVVDSIQLLQVRPDGSERVILARSGGEINVPSMYASDVAVGPRGELYVSDNQRHVVRKIG